MSTASLRGRPRRVAAAPVPVATEGVLRRLLREIAVWYRRSSQRSLLAELDDQALKDMGLTRYDVAHEVRKPFWHG